MRNSLTIIATVVTVMFVATDARAQGSTSDAIKNTGNALSTAGSKQRTAPSPPPTRPRDASTGMATGKRQYKPIQVR
jgi:hypothetical protein